MVSIYRWHDLIYRNLEDFTKKKKNNLYVITEFRKVAWQKINIQNPKFFYTLYRLSEKEIKQCHLKWQEK